MLSKSVWIWYHSIEFLFVVQVHNKAKDFMNSTLNTYIAAVTNTGLSPEFHLASLRMGSAGSFCRPPLVVDLFSQSEKSQRSKSRPSFGGVTVLSTALVEIGLIPSSDAVEITFSSSSTTDSLDCRSPSRYSRTSTHSTTKLQLTFLSNTITNQLCT